MPAPNRQSGRREDVECAACVDWGCLFAHDDDDGDDGSGGGGDDDDDDD